MKIRPLGAELFHADGQTARKTDITMLIVAFRNFAKTPKNSVSSSYVHYEVPSITGVQGNIRTHITRF